MALVAVVTIRHTTPASAAPRGHLPVGCLERHIRMFWPTALGY